MMSLYFSQAHVSLSYFLPSDFYFVSRICCFNFCFQYTSQLHLIQIMNSVTSQIDQNSVSSVPSQSIYRGHSITSALLLLSFVLSLCLGQLPPDTPMATFTLLSNLKHDLFREAFPGPVPFSLDFMLQLSNVCSSRLYFSCYSFFVFLHWNVNFNIPCISSSKNIQNIRHTKSEIKMSYCGSNCISILSMSCFSWLLFQHYVLPNPENYFNKYLNK